MVVKQRTENLYLDFFLYLFYFYFYDIIYFVISPEAVNVCSDCARGDKYVYIYFMTLYGFSSRDKNQRLWVKGKMRVECCGKCK